MSFWSDKLAELRPAAPAPRATESWWQPQPSVPPVRPVQPISALPSQNTGDYTPDTSGRLGAAPDRCPRCGSEDYLEVALDPSYGGRTGMSTTGVNLGQAKRCFDCRYPGFDPSGNVVRGKSAPVRGAKLQQRQVRQAGGGLDGSWGGQATWDAAPLIA